MELVTLNDGEEWYLLFIFSLLQVALEKLSYEYETKIKYSQDKEEVRLI